MNLDNVVNAFAKNKTGFFLSRRYDMFGDIPIQRARVFSNQESLVIDSVLLEAGHQYGPHFHSISHEKLYIISGTGVLLVNEMEFPYDHAEDMDPSKRLHIEIPQNTPHGFRVEKDTYVLAVQIPEVRANDIHPV